MFAVGERVYECLGEIVENMKNLSFSIFAFAPITHHVLKSVTVPLRSGTVKIENKKVVFSSFCLSVVGQASKINNWVLAS